MIEPDYSSIIAERITMPYDDENTFLKLSYGDPKLKDYSLITVLDTKLGSASNERVSTFILRYPRYVHAEQLRHRVISRNASSSRARSVRSTLREVMENPVIPLFTVNQKGMGGRFADEATREELIAGWLRGRDRAVASVLELLVSPSIFEKYGSDSDVAEHWEEILDDYYANGYDGNGELKEGYLSAHKQNFNRIIEPYSQFEEVVTSTYWDNYLNLRVHEDAQPEIMASAILVQKALELSSPKEREIHLPFIAEADYPDIESWLNGEITWNGDVKEVFMRSSAEAAQISYNDKSTAARSTASAALGARLFESHHLSPFEHPAIARALYEKLAIHEGLERDLSKLASNFDSSWVQLRPILAGITK